MRDCFNLDNWHVSIDWLFFCGTFISETDFAYDILLMFGAQQIHGLLLSLNLTSIEVKTINCLESLRGGILVAVSGLVRTKDFNGKRKFVQTFLLAPQDTGYFVLNDIFQFSDDNGVYQHPPTSLVNSVPQMHFSTSYNAPEQGKDSLARVL